MPLSLASRLKHAWNAFRDRDPTTAPYAYDLGPSYGVRPDRTRLHMGNERSIVNSVYTRIAIDVSSVNIRHVRLDQNERFTEAIDSGLNNCLTLEANIDQTARNFIQDVVLSMFDEGCVAIVPTDRMINPNSSGFQDILALRTGKVVAWYPAHVRVNVYNEQSGMREEITIPKRDVAIIENPLYSIMNEPNSTLQRLIHKLNLLDVIDDQSGSGKLDLIIQLPYVVKTPARLEQAENRRKDIEEQLIGSKYGIAYIDGTEKVTQLNRPAENNLMGQIQYLAKMLFNQLGLTESIFDGTADEKTLINYHNRTIDPILSALTDGMKRRFLTKTARTQGQSIVAMRDPFKFVPASELATMADSLTRNEILTSNEFRGIIGFKPSTEKGADTLRNKNLNPASPAPAPKENTDSVSPEEINTDEGAVNGSS